jgi:hypothetical protein
MIFHLMMFVSLSTTLISKIASEMTKIEWFSLDGVLTLLHSGNQVWSVHESVISESIVNGGEFLNARKAVCLEKCSEKVRLNGRISWSRSWRRSDLGGEWICWLKMKLWRI